MASRLVALAAARAVAAQTTTPYPLSYMSVSTPVTATISGGPPAWVSSQPAATCASWCWAGGAVRISLGGVNAVNGDTAVSWTMTTQRSGSAPTYGGVFGIGASSCTCSSIALYSVSTPSAPSPGWDGSAVSGTSTEWGNVGYYPQWGFVFLGAHTWATVGAWSNSPVAFVGGNPFYAFPSPSAAATATPVPSTSAPPAPSLTAPATVPPSPTASASVAPTVFNACEMLLVAASDCGTEFRAPLDDGVDVCFYNLTVSNRDSAATIAYAPADPPANGHCAAMTLTSTTAEFPANGTPDTGPVSWGPAAANGRVCNGALLYYSYGPSCVATYWVTAGTCFGQSAGCADGGAPSVGSPAGPSAAPSSPLAAIVGGVVGGFALVLLAILAVVLLPRVRRVAPLRAPAPPPSPVAVSDSRATMNAMFHPSARVAADKV